MFPHPIKAGFDLASISAALSALTWLPPALAVIASIASISWVVYSFIKEYRDTHK
jgi:hypothetical protein